MRIPYEVLEGSLETIKRYKAEHSIDWDSIELNRKSDCYVLRIPSRKHITFYEKKISYYSEKDKILHKLGGIHGRANTQPAALLADRTAEETADEAGVHKRAGAQNDSKGSEC